MLFDKNETEFKSGIHRHIWGWGLKTSLIETTLREEKIYGLGEGLMEGCRQWYALTRRLQQEMFESPESFSLKCSEVLDIYIDMPYTLMTLGGRLGEGGSYIVLKPAYEHMLVSVKNRLKNSGVTGVITNAIVDCYFKNGFAVKDRGSEIILTNGQYPLLFPAMFEMWRNVQNDRVFGIHNFKYLDFRMLSGKYRPSYDDIMRILSFDKRFIADDVTDFLSRLGVNPVGYSHWKVQYRYKKGVLCSVDTSNFEYDFSGGAFRTDDRDKSVFNAVFAKMTADDITGCRDFFMRHLDGCIGCNPKCGGNQVTVFRQSRNVHSIPFGLRDRFDSPSCLKYLKKLIEVGMAQIDAVSFGRSADGDGAEGSEDAE